MSMLSQQACLRIDTLDTRTKTEGERKQRVIGRFLRFIHLAVCLWMSSTQQLDRALREGKALDQLVEDLAGVSEVKRVIPDEGIAPIGAIHIGIVTAAPPDEKTRLLVRLAVANVSARHRLHITYRFQDQSQ